MGKQGAEGEDTGESLRYDEDAEWIVRGDDSYEFKTFKEHFGEKGLEEVGDCSLILESRMGLFIRTNFFISPRIVNRIRQWLNRKITPTCSFDDSSPFAKSF
jgi:hypothetical protein